MSEEIYDYLVIGSGPGGYVSAIRASQLGLKTAVVEKSELGGVCLNWGCIPTKSLLESAHFFHKIQENDLGIGFKAQPTANLEKIVNRSRDIANGLSQGIQHLFKKYKVDLIRGRGYIHSANEVHVFDKKDQPVKKVNAKNICIATGARAKELPHLKFSKNVLSYREAMVLKKLPKKILVIGAGAIGCEFADFFCCLGSKVTLVEAAPHILPNEEISLAKELKKAFQKKGMLVLEESSVTELKDEGKLVRGYISEKNGRDQKAQKGTKEEVFDTVLLSVGIEANLSGIGLENLGINIEKSRLTTNEFCLVKGTKNIFAIGDIIHGKQLAHKASHEGMISAEKAAGKNPHPFNHHDVPSCTYTSPQVASVGFSRSELEEKKVPFQEGRFPFSASGKALAAGEVTGFLTSYVHKDTGELLGAHYIGENVTELISNFTLARSSELTHDDFLAAIFPHPTLAEMSHESVGQAVEKSVNF